MDMTPTQFELLFAAHMLARENRGMVIADEAYPAAHELAEHGWLSRRLEPSRTANSPGGGRRRPRLRSGWAT